AHTLKGMVSNFCSEGALTAASELELAALQQSADRSTLALAASKRSVLQLLAELDVFLKSPQN
ncbi:MAG TPA: hypothetical protein VM452_07480, partial [Caulifigura sp.]|nr:hypothetical protein [Caulifigura sp.]